MLWVIASAAIPAQSPVPLTTLTGIIRDTTGALVTAGRIAFTTTLTGSQDATIPGVARFVPATTYCGISAAGSPVGLAAGVQSGPCTIVSNTALSPADTSYIVAIQPYNVTPGGQFNFYALAGQTVDISTIAPTPGRLPTNYLGVQGPPGCLIGSTCAALGPVTQSFTYPSGGGTHQFTHNLSSSFPLVTCWDARGSDQVRYSRVVINANIIAITVAGAGLLTCTFMGGAQ